MKNSNKNVKTKENVKVPYSSGYLAENLKLCLKPLLEKRNVVKKWSPIVPEFMEMSLNGLSYDTEYVEEHLLMKINQKTYANLFNTINDGTIKLIGKSFIQHDINKIEIKELMLQIKKGFYDIHNIRCCLDSWLYCEADVYNSEDFADLCDVIIDTQGKFDTIYENYNKMKIKNIDFKDMDSEDMPWYIQKRIKEISSIYERVLQLGAKVFKLDVDERLYPYIDILKDFARNLANELIYVVGELYLCADEEKNIYSKSKDKIMKYFEKLEENCVRGQQKLKYIFNELNKNSNYGSIIDEELLYAYQELKAATNTMIISNWR